jgi:uroporphyrinogen-III synthase
VDVVAELAGWTVGVTAARKADELAGLLRRRGADVVAGPAIRIVPVADDAELLDATRAVLAAPVDVVVATTGVGFRGWLEAARGRGLGEALLDRFAAARLLARGPKATGAIRGAGLTETWSPASESSAEVLTHLLDAGVAGQRIAVQLHGDPLTAFLDALTTAGAEVLPVPVYRWTAPADPEPLHRLIDAVFVGRIDALTFTSAPAVTSVLRVAASRGRLPELLELLRTDVLAACVGPICAAPLTEHGVPAVRPDRARLGALARLLAAELPGRARSVRAGGHALELRGQAVLVDGELVRLPPAAMAVLRDLTAGRPVPADEIAVAELRAALGRPGLVESVPGGYRLAP